jgi:hypothetical protein
MQRAVGDGGRAVARSPGVQNKELDELRGSNAQISILLLSKNTELDLLREQNRQLKDEVVLLNKQLEEVRGENKKMRD